jgi:2-oxoglutarate ferredoxin oxidoreductase subunit alpha
MEQINLRLQEKYRRLCQSEVRFEPVMLDDADVVLVAYGLAARVAHRAAELARHKGIRAGLLRPITLYPFPSEALKNLTARTHGILVVEMNAGRMGGIIPSAEEIVQVLHRIINTPKHGIARDKENGS